MENTVPTRYKTALKATGATYNDNHKLASLPQFALQEILKDLRSQETNFRRKINYLNGLLLQIEGKKQAELALEAEFAIDVDIINPGLYPKVGLTLGDCYYEHGRTTFQICGGCKHYNRTMDGVIRCEILSACNVTRSVSYRDNCHIRALSEEALVQLAVRFNRAIRNRRLQLSFVRAQLRKLSDLIVKHIRWPTLPNGNSYGIEARTKYAYGDRVRVFVHSLGCKPKYRNTWQPATVTVGGGNGFVVCFDYPIMTGEEPSTLKRATWPHHSWAIRDHTYIVLHEWEYRNLRVMHQRDPNEYFLTKWRGDFGFEMSGWDLQYGTSPQIPAIHIVNELLMGKVRKPISHTKRLMSAAEACEIFSFGDYPKTAEAVVERFREARQKRTDDEIILQQAKDTLLLRIYGSQSLDF